MKSSILIKNGLVYDPLNNIDGEKKEIHIKEGVIVERVENVLVMIDELEKQVSGRKEQSEKLTQSILREAFATS